MAQSIFRKKELARLLSDTELEGHKLRRTLSVWDLTALGIGCIIGVGVFVLPGVEAAKHAGPGIILSFAIAGLACACSALCYSELASMIPVAGSAYTYGYATLGELPAWIIGWDLLLEYMVAACLVSIGWSAYLVNLLNNILRGWGLALPPSLVNAPIEWNTEIHKFVSTGAVINIPAIFIVLLLTGLLVRGIKESSRVNMIIVIVKIAVIVFFIVLAVWHIKPSNWTPFMPFGFGGVMTAAAIVFLAFVGFDAISTAAEEAKNPQRDMPRAIMSSLAVATILYMAVSAIMTGTVPYDKLGVPDPVALVLNELRMPWASSIVSVGALAGITSVLLVLILGQPRILFAMSRDGLLPPALSHVHKKYKTPHKTTILTGGIVAVAAGLLPIQVVAELCSIGTLFAFIIVCSGVLVLRYTRRDIHRPFKTPLFPFVPAAGVLLCGYLMINLPRTAWERFLIWLIIGLAIYFSYSRRNSGLRREPSEQIEADIKI
ncbi:MAG TPA: amino acid permease [Candidatus Aminicenantes bacterium]|jgi:Amino acid transporters|nr:amino acid permease [Acidobacteriota bacterium]OQB58549.1 MAG: putative amino acid permease YhdG [Candidatus Aminicenantes bacterium ADurb.Bin147]HNQ79932.1 amino acid permease [Candidatus Aminicenantes bacterium]MDD8028175.1 amino acid permease [Acidobacteriota bacterium]MDD8038890.1 amino acid permease [Acidobacteriota bacterium]